jgi:hypothetical protein
VIQRSPKIPEITNRLAAPVEIEQYHKMCARTQIIRQATSGVLPQGNRISKQLQQSEEEFVVPACTFEFSAQ